MQVVVRVMLVIAPRDLTSLLVYNAFPVSFGAAGAVMFWAMLPDTVEYGEWRSRVRDEDIVFGLIQLVLKAASGIGVGLLGIALGAIGSIANETQSAETLSSLRALTFGAPLLGSTLCLLSICWYPIDKPLHDRLRRATSWRQRSI